MIKKLTDKQLEIIDVSRNLFFEKGYAETSMRDIASKLNIRAASIYSHFDSKEQILGYIIGNHAKLMEDALCLIKNQNIPIEERFRAYVKIHIENHIGNKESSQLYIKYFEIVDKNLGGKYYDLNFSFLHSITRFLKERFPNIEDPEDLVSDFNALLFLDSLNTSTQWINPENIDYDRITDIFCRYFTFGFSAPQP